MTFGEDVLLERLSELEVVAAEASRYVIAISGGLDSTVLLHAMATARSRHQKTLVAVYVDHQLQSASADWRDACRKIASELSVDFVAETVKVDLNSGAGLEAAAREARYGALRSHIEAGDWLLSAHHRDDQAETLLLNLMRGSGPIGLAGIAAIRPFARGWLARPLLGVSRAELLSYADRTGLQWIDDPSNTDLGFDRNFLRHDILPRLEERWPDTVSRLAKSADLAGEAAMLLAELAETDLQTLGARPDRLSIDGLHALPAERQRNVLRHAVRRIGLPMPGASHLSTIVGDLLTAKEDAQPLIRWRGAEARRYRDQLYLLPASDTDVAAPDERLVAGDRVNLHMGQGALTLAPGAPVGLSDGVIVDGLRLQYRHGGEEIQPIGQAHTRKLKKLLQEEGIVPWMRDRLPLLYAGQRLVAVADLWIAADAASEPGNAVVWEQRPPIH